MKIFDLHADIGTDCLAHEDDINRFDAYHLPKLEKGEVTTVVAASFFSGTESWEVMQKMITTTRNQLIKSKVNFVRNKALLDDSKYNAILSVEGMCGIQEEVEDKIKWLKEHNILIGSLCWNESNALATGKLGSKDRGLTDLGKRVITKMDECGIVIDVSHANEKTFWDIVKTSNKSIIATHSNAKALCSAERNLSDDQIREIAKRGGIIGLNACRYFIDDKEDNQDAKHLALHGKYIAELVGHKHVAIGFDFMDYFEDGSNSMGKDLVSAIDAQNLVVELEKYFTKKEVEDICYNNAYNFIKNF